MGSQYLKRPIFIFSEFNIGQIDAVQRSTRHTANQMVGFGLIIHKQFMLDA